MSLMVKLYLPFETAFDVKQVCLTLLLSCGLMYNGKFISWAFCTISRVRHNVFICLFLFILSFPSDI